MPAQPSGTRSVWFGLAFMAAGIAIIAAVWIDPAQARAPVWVVEAAGALFAFAGLGVVLDRFGLVVAARLSWLVMIYLLAVPGLWTLFDSGASCTVRGALSGAAFNGDVTSVMCRAVLGGGGIIALLAAIGFSLMALFQRKAAGLSAAVDNPPTEK